MTARPLLEVTAALRLHIEEEEVHVSSEGRHVVVALPSLRAGSMLMRPVGPAKGRLNRLRAADEWLRAAGLTVDVHLAGRPLARLGAGARPGAPARLIRTVALGLRPGPSLRTALKRHAGSLALALGLAGLATLFVVVRRRGQAAPPSSLQW